MRYLFNVKLNTCNAMKCYKDAIKMFAGAQIIHILMDNNTQIYIASVVKQSPFVSMFEKKITIFTKDSIMQIQYCVQERKKNCLTC